MMQCNAIENTTNNSDLNWVQAFNQHHWLLLKIIIRKSEQDRNKQEREREIQCLYKLSSVEVVEVNRSVGQ